MAFSFRQSCNRAVPNESTLANCFSSDSTTFATRSAESAKLRISTLHQIADGIDHLIEKWLLLAQQPAMPDAAAENFAQDVTAAFIRRQNPVVDQEGGRAGVVGDDAQACGLPTIRSASQ